MASTVSMKNKLSSNFVTNFQIRCSRKNNVRTSASNDNKLTDFGKAILADRYLLEGETIQQAFARVAHYYSDNDMHAQRLYDYMSSLYFMPATPILSNGGAKRGMPISCFVNEVADSLTDIVDIWNENVWLASKGGGIGTYWGNVRSIGEKVAGNGKTSGIIPFIGVQDRMTLAISQGNLRRGSAAVYLPVSHPEIDEFVEMRRITGGDPNRRSLNLHHGVIITDDFMIAVQNDSPWELKSPVTNQVVSIIKARDLWIRILNARIETGEPYLLFIDTVNKKRPRVYEAQDLKVKTSNLCSEITLATGRDFLGHERTSVCCLASVNLETYDQWKDDIYFIEDIMRFLDNVLTDFILHAPDSMEKAKYSAYRERSIGLGVMGFHSFLQSKMVPFESVTAKAWNRQIFKHIRMRADEVSKILAKERGPCQDAAEKGILERFTHKLAIAPTASISVIAGNSSPGIEPYNANSYTQKTLTGSFNVKNKHLKKLLQKKDQDTDAVWSSIMMNEGSVQHLDFLEENEKAVFKTAFEIDQMWVIEHAADRTAFICQSQSLNIFIPADIHKRDLHRIHFAAWQKGVKSMYYCRSRSVQRADNSYSNILNKPVQLEMKLEPVHNDNKEDNKYEECLACQ